MCPRLATHRAPEPPIQVQGCRPSLSQEMREVPSPGQEPEPPALCFVAWLQEEGVGATQERGPQGAAVTAPFLPALRARVCV
jgi:hypothetical protein